jgi:prepilin-type processing-associated H-X9-DG protein
MQQILRYTQNTNVYNCPANAQLPQDMQGPFDYFNGCRAAYVTSDPDPSLWHFAAVKNTKILFTTAFVLSGDTCGIPDNSDDGRDFEPLNADKDDYTQNCVGGEDNGDPWELWQVHTLGQNLLFADGHVKWYKGYNTNEMTFRYDSIHGWQ